jgi:hydroxypyruvate isomerase
VQTHGLRFDANCAILFTEPPPLKRPAAGDLAGVLARDAADIAHIQVADVPERGAPGTGTLYYEALFGQLAAQDYPGWIGCEYKPSDPADSTTSFGWR